MKMATKRPLPTLMESDTLLQLILDHYVTLSEGLHVRNIIRYLQQERILKLDDKEEILECTTSQEKAEKLLDKVMAFGTCTPSLFVAVLRRSGHGHLADMLQGKPNSKVARTEGISDMTDSQVEELRGRLRRLYLRQPIATNSSLTILLGMMGGGKSSFINSFYMSVKGTWSDSFEQVMRRLSVRTAAAPAIVIKEETSCQVGTALVADWVGDKKVTSDFEQVYKLGLDKVRKEDTLMDTIFDQLLHDPDYKPTFSKESLWNYMEQTQEKILFVLDGLDRLNPFTSPEILQLIDKKLLPRASVIVTVAEENAA